MEKRIIELDEIDSTNNYATNLANNNMASHGMTIYALRQSEGKGQRGRQWHSEPGKSIAMSIIVQPETDLAKQFLFSCSVAVAIADYLAHIYENLNVKIKWPNDIILNDKKAGGILIENIVRGHQWAYAIVGIGINVNIEKFPDNLSFATSIRKETNTECDMLAVRDGLIDAVLNCLGNKLLTEAQIMQQYNNRLYKKNQPQIISRQDMKWEAVPLEVTADGLLWVVLQNGVKASYKHGDIVWQYENQT